MLEKFYPYEYTESVFTIDYNKLYRMGYRGIIFDIDNTLAHHGENPTIKVEKLFQIIHKIGFRTILLSDNNKERIESFLKNIKSMYIEEADKPNPGNFLKAVKMLDLKKEQVIYIGDQIFTDIYGANRCNIPNILVKYLRHSENEKTGKRRRVENIILWFYKRNKKYTNRIGDIFKEEI